MTTLSISSYAWPISVLITTKRYYVRYTMLPQPQCCFMEWPFNVKYGSFSLMSWCGRMPYKIECQWRGLHVCLYAWASNHFGKIKKIKKKKKKTTTDEKDRDRFILYSSDLGLRIQFNDEIGRWKTRWNMSEVKPKTLYETLVLTNIELYPYIATILLTLLTMHASTVLKRMLLLGVQ